MSKKVHRLIDQFQPENYQLSLRLDRDNMSFSGQVIIRGKKVGAPAERITFHQKELKVTAATITKHDKKGDKEITVRRINNQDTLNEVRLHADETVYPGSYTVTMEFKGIITDPMNGIYPCYFKHAGQDKKLIATQFESHHAREAFPCIDEPSAKATFDLAVDTPAGETTLGNTPIKSQKTDNERQHTVFETTPRMSAYLLAFVTGDMGYKEAKTKHGVTVRAYATPDNVADTGFGLEGAVKILDFFTDYFNVPYPLPKLDMVALPDFNVGAMENWGLMTFRETAMLADPKNSSIESKQRVALVVAHEASHQWFGNLVTMKWWDDLWLNESFANLMEYVAVDAIYPEWQIWEEFVSYESASAKRRDSLADVQSIRSDVNDPEEINVIFDPSIVYAKGGNILRMLMDYIGEDAFRQGLKIYFDKHSYGNTEAGDLWQAFSQSSGQDIDSFMDGWLRRPGYPLVDIDWQPGDKKISLSQRRFLSDPTISANPKDDKPWQVPLAATWNLDSPLLAKKKTQAGLKTEGAGPFLLNHDGQSYFLPNYLNDKHKQSIVDALRSDQVDNIDRLLLLDNTTLLQRGGQSSTVDLLELLSGYEDEDSESVWGSMAVAIGEARRLIEGHDAIETTLNSLVTDLVMALTEKLGWEDKPNDSAQTLRLRGMTHGIAAGAKSQPIINEGLELFSKCRKPADISASTRTVVYSVAARHGSMADFNKLLKMYHGTQNADEREEIASGLTAAKDSKRYEELLKMLKTDAIRRQDFFHWYAWLLRNRYSRQATWRWLTGEWEWIRQNFSSDKNLSYFARYPGSVFSRTAELKEFKQFFEPKKSIVSMGHDISLAEAEITSRIAWRKRNEASVKEWLSKYRLKS